MLYQNYFLPELRGFVWLLQMNFMLCALIMLISPQTQAALHIIMHESLKVWLGFPIKCMQIDCYLVYHLLFPSLLEYAW